MRKFLSSSVSTRLACKQVKHPTLPFDLIQEFYNGLVLLYALSVEVLTHCIGKLVLALSSLLLLSSHCRRKVTDTRASQDQLVIIAAESGWCLEAVCVSI